MISQKLNQRGQETVAEAKEEVDYRSMEKEKLPIVLKRLEKKMNQINALKERQEEGKPLTKLQLKKIQTESMILGDIEKVKELLK